MTGGLVPTWTVLVLAACNGSSTGPVVEAPAVPGTWDGGTGMAAPSVEPPTEPAGLPPKELVFQAGRADESIPVSSREGANLDLDVRVVVRVISESTLRQRFGTGDVRDARNFLRTTVREALSGTAGERGIIDLWGAGRPEWVAAAVAVARPSLANAGLTLERIDLVTVRVAPAIEQAMRRSGVTPGP